MENLIDTLIEENIDPMEQADLYAKEATCGLSFIKGFPLSTNQILGYIEIFNAYKRAANIIYETEGRQPDAETFYRSIYEDFSDFIDTDIPLNPELCARIVFSYTVHKVTALYILKHDINTIADMNDAQHMIERLVKEQRWEELQRITGITKLWQEI